LKKHNTKSRRLFLALWPEPEVRGQIGACQQSLSFHNDSGRCALPVKTENLHLTLRFLGAVAEDQMDALCSRLARVEHAEFELQLRGFGYFVSPGIVWLGLKLPQPALQQLVELLEVAVAEVLPEQKSRSGNFIAHVSLCKNAAVLPEATSCDSIHWAVDEFALVESINTADGVTYQVLQRWPLISPATPAP
jgi:RNA 2',3'-cyclic 3'-phosphodiesterase